MGNPDGISFFTFQALGYKFDVYHKRITAEKDFLTYALFISFFPSIVAGPINKASLVIPQIKALRPYFDYPKAIEGLKMLLWGMFMKVVVADRLALYVDTVFHNYMNYTGLTCFVASLLYTIPIYADFAAVFFVLSPIWYGMDTLQFHPLKYICETHSIPFIDFSNNPNCVHNDDLFIDGHHLNEKGADAFTQELIQF